MEDDDLDTGIGHLASRPRHLRLPEGDLAAVRRVHHAAPTGRPLAGLEQDAGAEALSTLGRRSDVRYGGIGQPQRALGAARHDPTAQIAAEVEGKVLAPRRLDALRAPAQQLPVKEGGPCAVMGVKLQMNKWTW